MTNSDARSLFNVNVNAVQSVGIQYGLVAPAIGFA